MPQLEIRAMNDADVAEVSRLLYSCFGWLADTEGFNDRQRAFLMGPRSSEQTIREEARTRPHYVACRDGRIAGIVVVNGNVIARLYVRPENHRQGVGRAMFEAAENVIRSAGHHEARVGALVDSAVAFYESMGMKVIGEEPYEPEIFPDRCVRLMSKPL